MEFNNQALILKVGRFREADLWVRFFSREHGLLTAFAFGGSRSRRRFCGCLDPLNQVHFKIRRSARNGYLCLLEGVLLSSPNRIRTDRRRLGMAANCLKFLEAALPGATGSPQAYELGLGTLKLLDQAAEIPDITPTMFKASLLLEQGLYPNLRFCAACGRELDGTAGAYLDIEQGATVCALCPPPTGMRAPLDADALSTLQNLAHTPPQAWPQIKLAVPSRQAVSRAVEAMVTYHLGLCWENGRYKQK